MGNCYIYLRVSSEIQGDRETYKTQLAELEEHAKKHNLQVSNVYLDIISAREPVRQNLQKMIAAAGPGDIILIYDQDRLSRDTVETLTPKYKLAVSGECKSSMLFHLNP